LPSGYLMGILDTVGGFDRISPRAYEDLRLAWSQLQNFITEVKENETISRAKLTPFLQALEQPIEYILMRQRRTMVRRYIPRKDSEAEE
jgi:hypothetical protein